MVKTNAGLLRETIYGTVFEPAIGSYRSTPKLVAGFNVSADYYSYLDGQSCVWTADKSCERELGISPLRLDRLLGLS